MSKVKMQGTYRTAFNDVFKFRQNTRQQLINITEIQSLS